MVIPVEYEGRILGLGFCTSLTDPQTTTLTIPTHTQESSHAFLNTSTIKALETEIKLLKTNITDLAIWTGGRARRFPGIPSDRRTMNVELRG